MKKPRAVVFSFTGNLTFAVASVTMDVARFCKDWVDEIVCIHDGTVTEQDKTCLSKIFPVRFIKYECPIDDFSSFNQQTISYFTHMVFSKFECLRLLNEYETITFMDYDMVIRTNIDELFEPCKSGIKMLLDGSVRSQFHPEHRNLEIDHINMDGPGICASLFTFHDTLPKFMEMYHFVYDITKQYAPYLFGIEQFAFSVMLQKYGLTDLVSLDLKSYNVHPKSEVNNPKAKILHAYGQPKFWNGLDNEQWNGNYAAWVRIGGGKIIKPPLFRRIFGKFNKVLSELIVRFELRS